MDIYLIRHGKTTANEKGLYCGQTDLPLSDNGAGLIEHLRDQGIYPKDIALYFTSGLLRARQTIARIYGPVHAQAIPELAEYKFGQFEMRSYEELKKRADYQAWINDSTGLVSCPAGENKRQFLERILAGFDTLLQKSSQAESALLAGHGGVIAGIMDHLFPHTRNFYEWQPQPGRGYTLLYASGRLCGYKKI